MSEPLWDSGGEHHSVPESWVHDVELPNLQKKAGMLRRILGPERLVGS